ncbi:hypothetical protein BH09GEM1_BH09GEM1_46650 [soil metagenome]
MQVLQKSPLPLDRPICHDGNLSSPRAGKPALESLCLWSIPIKKLSVLAPLQQLRVLDLRQIMALKSLDGIEAFPLERLNLTYI